MTAEQELERLRRERAAIAERLGVDPSRPLAIISVLDKWRGERDAAVSRAEWAEGMLRRVSGALNAIDAPLTGPCDPIISETGRRALQADERILALKATP